MLTSNKSCIAYIWRGNEDAPLKCKFNTTKNLKLKIINHKSAEIPLLNSLNFGNVEIKFKESQYKSYWCLL